MNSYYPKGTDLSFEAIPHEEEKALFAKAKAGDAVAKEQLIKSHLLFVAGLARRLSRGRLPDDEAVSAANFALVSCFDRFDPAFPNRFAAYLKIHVRGAIAKLWSERNVVSKSDFSDGVAIVSVPVTENAEEDTTVEDADHHRFMLKLLEQSKNVLDTRENLIMELLFSETPMNQSDVARRLKLSRERVRQIFDAALEKLRREMRNRMNSAGV